MILPWRNKMKPQLTPVVDRERLEAEFLAGTISEGDEKELRNLLAPGSWFELLERRDQPKRAAFLKDAPPAKVLLWIMRSPTSTPELMAQCAIALLPHMPPDKHDIE
jgi:hypothetical protein